MAVVTLEALYWRSRDALRAAAVGSPDLDARWLVAAAANVDPAAVALHGRVPVGDDQIATADAYLARRLAGEPVDRILGSRDFWGLTFSLEPATLSPRPDTETLVEAALGALPGQDAVGAILDLGTGSGAILVALLTERPRMTGIGVDRSHAAVLAARANAEANRVGQRACFVAGDWGTALAHRFGLIVSNPPYVATTAMRSLAPEVVGHDPHVALDGGADGLDAYRAILADARRLLTPRGTLVLELGAGQEVAVAGIARAAGLQPTGPARPDLRGIPRALVLQQAAAA